MSGGITAFLLVFLFLLSGFFSASETALFSLRRDDREWMIGHRTRAARCVIELLEKPRELLVAVLFGNLLVNFLLMAIAASLMDDLAEHGPLGILLGFLLTTASVVVLGEVTPKSMAVTAPRRVSLIASPFLLAFRNATRLVTRPLGRMTAWLLDLVERPLAAPRGALTDQELKAFVELQGEEGQIERQASQFLAESLELGSRRIHEVMTHRVDIAALDVAAGRAGFLELVRERRVGKVLVHSGGGLDTINGYVRTRDFLQHPDRPLEELVNPVWYVPSTKSLESLLSELIERHEPLALVVGEYGGTDGLVTLEDVVEEITGDIAREDAGPLVQPGDDGTWVMAGGFPLREAGELLGVSLDVPGATTLSGFVAERLGRIPEVGDTVWHAGIQLSVASVERRRVREVVVALPQPGQTAPSGGEVPLALTTSGAIRATARLTSWVEEEEASPEQRNGSSPKGEES